MSDPINSAKTKALEFLKSRSSTRSFKMIKAFQSYMTGLQYFPSEPKPKFQEVYICKRFDNPRFPNSIKIYCNHDDIAYVPKDLAANLVEDMDDFLESRVLLCFCLKEPTKFSATCIFMLFEVEVEKLIV